MNAQAVQYNSRHCEKQKGNGDNRTKDRCSIHLTAENNRCVTCCGREGERKIERDITKAEGKNCPFCKNQ